MRDSNVQAPIIWDHLSWCPFVCDPNVRAPIVRNPFAWCPFILVPVCPGAHLSGSQMSKNRLLHPTPPFDYQQAFAKVFGYRQIARFKLRRHCLFHQFLLVFDQTLCQNVTKVLNLTGCMLFSVSYRFIIIFEPVRYRNAKQCICPEFAQRF